MLIPHYSKKRSDVSGFSPYDTYTLSISAKCNAVIQRAFDQVGGFFKHDIYIIVHMRADDDMLCLIERLFHECRINRGLTIRLYE